MMDSKKDTSVIVSRCAKPQVHNRTLVRFLTFLFMLNEITAVSGLSSSRAANP